MQHQTAAAPSIYDIMYEGKHDVDMFDGSDMIDEMEVQLPEILSFYFISYLFLVVLCGITFFVLLYITYKVTGLVL